MLRPQRKFLPSVQVTQCMYHIYVPYLAGVALPSFTICKTNFWSRGKTVLFLSLKNHPGSGKKEDLFDNFLVSPTFKPSGGKRKKRTSAPSEDRGRKPSNHIPVKSEGKKRRNKRQPISLQKLAGICYRRIFLRLKSLLFWFSPFGYCTLCSLSLKRSCTVSLGKILREKEVCPFFFFFPIFYSDTRIHGHIRTLPLSILFSLPPRGQEMLLLLLHM